MIHAYYKKFKQVYFISSRLFFKIRITLFSTKIRGLIFVDHACTLRGSMSNM